MPLNFQDIGRLRSVLGEHPSSVPSTDFWRWMNTRYGVGSRQRKRIVLEPNDFRKLQRILEREEGAVKPEAEAGPSSVGRSTTRIEAARFSTEEKLGRRAITHDLLLVRGAQDDCRFRWGTIPGEATAVAVTLDKVQEHLHDLVIIVENSEPFFGFSQRLLPEGLHKTDPLIVYKGGPGFSGSAHSKLVRRSSVPTVAFYDFDPAGIAMALDSEVDMILCPSLESLADYRRLHKDSAFLNQPRSIVSLQHYLTRVPRSEALCAYIEQMLSSRSAIMTEHIMAHDIPLEAVRNPLIDFKDSFPMH